MKTFPKLNHPFRGSKGEKRERFAIKIDETNFGESMSFLGEERKAIVNGFIQLGVMTKQNKN